MICGKIIYTDRKIALEAVKGAQRDKRQRKSDTKPNKVYWCNDCNGWHVTSSKKKNIIRSYTFEEKNQAREVRKDKSRNEFLIIHTNLKIK